jgi:hypothetical protein
VHLLRCKMSNVWTVCTQPRTVLSTTVVRSKKIPFRSVSLAITGLLTLLYVRRRARGQSQRPCTRRTAPPRLRASSSSPLRVSTIRVLHCPHVRVSRAPKSQIPRTTPAMRKGKVSSSETSRVRLYYMWNDTLLLSAATSLARSLALNEVHKHAIRLQHSSRWSRQSWGPWSWTAARWRQCRARTKHKRPPRRSIRERRVRGETMCHASTVGVCAIT